VVTNTLKVLEVAGRGDVCVARGAPRPLLQPVSPARHVYGDDGMADLGWPSPEGRPDPRHAVDLLADLLKDAACQGPAGRITLVTLAPLTNIALLLRTYPEVAAGLREIVLMGGAANAGNATASAEFNVWHDPEAAAIVLHSATELDIPVVMYGLDVFYDVLVTQEEAAALVEVGGRGPAELAGRLIEFQCHRFGKPHATIGDAGAVCSVVDRAGLTTKRLPVRVELAGTYSRGRTIVDRRDRARDIVSDPPGIGAALVDVAFAVDADRYAQLWLQTVDVRRS
jgi:pyrimidine-specific ribonucleoside hydrolase